jgi:2-haloacid dehalogenase
MVSEEKICLFDMNGTLVDMSALDENFQDIFGNKLYRKIWLKTVLHTSSSLTLTGRYETFAKIGEETLKSLADSEGISISLVQKASFKKNLLSLPLYPDVIPALKLLKEKGYRLIVFSNSSKKELKALLLLNNVDYLIEQVFSTDDFKEFKPSTGSYQGVSEKLGVKNSHLWMIAAHSWDILGSSTAGLKTALIERKETGHNDCFSDPDIREGNLEKLAERV